jgi:hypothetical protein
MGVGETKLAIIVDGETYRIVELRGGAVAIVVVDVVVPSVGTGLLAAVQALRRHLRTRPTGHGPTSSRSAGARVRQH